MAYHRVHAVKTRIIRIFNTYGPRMRTNDGRVVPNFCLQAIQGENLTVYGDGKQTRSFCYVDDLVEGILRVLITDHSEPINLGNPEEYTILDFAERIAKMSPTKGKAKSSFPLPIDDPKMRCPDITKAKKLLGWEPKIGLEAGLKKTYEYFKSEVERKPAPSQKISHSDKKSIKAEL